MAFQNMPAALQPVFQQNLLDRAFQDNLWGVTLFRKTTYKLPLPVRSGESMIYSRAGRISPVYEDLAPAANVAPDNGLATVVGGIGSAGTTPYPFEQYPVSIGMLPGSPIDLNLIQNQQTIASLFIQNMENIAANAGLSLDLRAIRFALRAYEGGNSYAKAAGTFATNTTVPVDNVYGFDTAFTTGTFQNGATFPYGLPLTVSPSQPQAIVIKPAAGGANISALVIGVALDGTNVSTQTANGLNTGASGTLTLQGNIAVAQFDTLVALDSQKVLRPNGKLNRHTMQNTDTIGAQLVINAVAELRRNGVKPPLSDGTYPCYIDPIVDAQFFTDPQYQIMSQGQMASQDFANARVSRNFGVTFIPVTNLPAYVSDTGVVTRRALLCGEKWLQESPFAGTETALKALPDMGVADYRFNDDIVFVNRMPIERAGQIMSSMWYWIGGFVVPTFATITSAVIPTATTSRYKAAIVIEVAASS